MLSRTPAFRAAGRKHTVHKGIIFSIQLLTILYTDFQICNNKIKAFSEVVSVASQLQGFWFNPEHWLPSRWSTRCSSQNRVDLLRVVVLIKCPKPLWYIDYVPTSPRCVCVCVCMILSNSGCVARIGSGSTRM